MRTHYRLRGGFSEDGAPLGAIIYFDANGKEKLLPIPSDWVAQEEAGTPYVLGIIAGIPAWRIGTETTTASGYGSNYGNDYGGPA